MHVERLRKMSIFEFYYGYKFVKKKEYYPYEYRAIFKDKYLLLFYRKKIYYTPRGCETK